MTRRCAFHLISAGSCSHPEAATLRGGSLCPTDFPALVGLILHPQEGPLLFDTGYDPAFFAATRPFPERLYRWATPVRLPSGAEASEQIRRFGLTPADVRGVILSHFHGDHVAGLTAFPNARLYCARAGLAEIRGTGRFGGVRKGLLAGLVPGDAQTRARYFEDLPRRALPADFAPFTDGADLLGDASLLAVELPGHCTGHWGLVLTGEDDRYRFLIGDAAWSLRAVREDRPPPRLTTALLGRTEPYRRTLSDLHALSARGGEVALIPSHCPEAAADESR